MTQKPKLPKYCYQRGNMIWCCVKDDTGKWVSKSTSYNLDQVDQAARYVKTLVRGFEAQRETETDSLVFRKYATRWVDDRETRGIDCASTERYRLDEYIFPFLGDLALAEVRPRHLREMVRALVARTGDEHLAPRTIHHIFNLVHNVFESAIVDEFVIGNPVKLNPGELPQKADDDAEWRINATYTTHEIEMHISHVKIPPERRILYALKALAGLRHGEAAALGWRHIDFTVKPLGRINVTRAWATPKKELKSTKTGEVRSVPLHSELARMLIAWRDDHWPRIYGHKPGPDDLVVPTRTGRCVSGKDAIEAHKRDLVVMGLRLKAGAHRDRGGHDMRSWFETQLIEDDADSTLSRRFTHAPPKTVAGGYERFSWATLCREMSKLSVKAPEGDPLPVPTALLQSAAIAGLRWQKVVTPKGLEAVPGSAPGTSKSRISVEETSVARASARLNSHDDVVASYSPNDDAIVSVDRAMQRGDFDLAHAIIRRMRERAPE